MTASNRIIERSSGPPEFASSSLELRLISSLRSFMSRRRAHASGVALEDDRVEVPEVDVVTPRFSDPMFRTYVLILVGQCTQPAQRRNIAWVMRGIVQAAWQMTQFWPRLRPNDATALDAAAYSVQHF
jgi:hypothetical protein